ncbi:hypothetical protein [Streptomyces longwoodensis]|uniref:hypothetical protein n=1 Tax=Streptomyces longwoodensis TaxID=68231 RepID=UPI0033C3BFC9
MRGEGDDLRTQLQLTAWIVQVLGIENHQRKEIRSQLEAQPDPRTARMIHPGGAPGEGGG